MTTPKTKTRKATSPDPALLHEVPSRRPLRPSAPHPGYRKLPMTAIIEVQPDRAKETILAAYRLAGANIPETAKRLECTWRTLYRWIAKLGLDEDLAKLKVKAAREGWLREGVSA
jgi:DNA-binding NtrC family response regulator